MIPKQYELFANACLAETFLSISSHHLCLFQCEEREIQKSLDCFEELACIYQVTGEILKATSVRGPFELNIWPQVMSFKRNMSRVHSLSAILPAQVDQGLQSSLH